MSTPAAAAAGVVVSSPSVSGVVHVPPASPLVSVSHLTAELVQLREENQRLLELVRTRSDRPDMTQAELEQMRRIFVQHCGGIANAVMPVAQLGTLLNDVGYPLSESELAEVIALFRDGVTFPGFLDWWRKEMERPDRQREHFKLKRFAHSKIYRSPEVRVESCGDVGTLHYRVFFFHGSEPISPWHDISLMAGSTMEEPLNFVCEIPKWTRAKYEIATGEVGNPIKQDTKNAVLRTYKWGDLMFNYGAFPQTWEDPEYIVPGTGLKGDNDPLDAVEIGMRQLRTGSVRPVKVLGVLALIDDGETDWKVIVIDIDDPMAPILNDIADVERELPGAVHAIREFFRVYKISEGKAANQFGFGGMAMNRQFALRVVGECHEHWKRLLRRRSSAANAGTEGGDAVHSSASMASMDGIADPRALSRTFGSMSSLQAHAQAMDGIDD